MRLTRTVRLALVPARGAAPQVAPWASADAWGASLELEVAVEGKPDPVTGYIIGIDAIDAQVRAVAGPALASGFSQASHPGACLTHIRGALACALALPVPFISLRPHPFAEIRVEESMSGFATLVHRFDFAASHRLHCPTLDDASNRRIFGKCNNPAGHGHNYRLETEVRVPLADTPGLRGGEVERIVREHAVDRLDHKHLNADVPDLRDINPSVERIAEVCHRWLADPLRAAGGELVRVRLWETEKTSAIYPG